jgi:hypothetical protein
MGAHEGAVAGPCTVVHEGRDMVHLQVTRLSSYMWIICLNLYSSHLHLPESYCRLCISICRASQCVQYKHVRYFGSDQFRYTHHLYKNDLIIGMIGP